MILYKIYIDGECACEIPEKSARVWLTDFYGDAKVDSLIKRLQAGEVVRLSKKSEMRV